MSCQTQKSAQNDNPEQTPPPSNNIDDKGNKQPNQPRTQDPINQPIPQKPNDPEKGDNKQPSQPPKDSGNSEIKDNKEITEPPKDDSSKIDDSKDNPAQGQDQKTEEFSKIRIGHWNVLNQAGNIDAKTEALAKIIHYNKLSLVGLTEIQGENSYAGVENIIKKLQEYDPNGLWRFILSENNFGKGRESQKERIGIIYKSKLLEQVPLAGYTATQNPYDLGMAYPNPEVVSHTNKAKKHVYSRPPYGAKFRVKNSYKNDFSVVFAHFDSPGAKKKAGEESARNGFKAQGEFEINDALETKAVMDWFDQKDGNNNDLFFMGDTNIKSPNGPKAFDPLIKSGYSSLLDQEDKTSLGTNENNPWSQPYDKIFYKGDLKTSNAQKYDIFKVFEQGVLNEQEWKNKINQETKTKLSESSPLIKWVRKISDHTLVFVDLDVDKPDVDN
ncbi:endonuclease/exonuclease/phosphatase family protein [Mycoplasma procyoni]|uniref:endonuclease/exonuclease/phosphatase family protein n=1 Tax=Mycoplasma procyoni TaxID=568784 RepID=UPI00197BC3BA|nr:endonuclease/exonuclease/phosphatase family protein [Mycoplasma procyoni]MBN3534437.1 hypothetical protein [Mycoplasma procyoni]